MKHIAARIAAAATLALFAHASFAADPVSKPAAAKPAKAVKTVAPAKKPAAPVSVNAEFASVVYKNAGSLVHNEEPQALLRAVVVLRVKVNEQNQWQAEVFRDNPDQPELTKVALDSVAQLPAPAGLSEAALTKLRNEGVIEAWLFQTDGRFALKALAKPQKRA
jgi:hypothetical protein